ncbi:MFS transporter, partial [archaeon]
MPILVNTLDIPPMDFGLMVSAFALSKLLVNLPTAYLVERYGRKVAITSGLMLCGVGVAGISLVLLPIPTLLPTLMLTPTAILIACRLLSGGGVSLFLGGGTVYLSDLS